MHTTLAHTEKPLEKVPCTKKRPAPDMNPVPGACRQGAILSPAR
jgi:hypothetical protein